MIQSFLSCTNVDKDQTFLSRQLLSNVVKTICDYVYDPLLPHSVEGSRKMWRLEQLPP